VLGITSKKKILHSKTSGMLFNNPNLLKEINGTQSLLRSLEILNRKKALKENQLNLKANGIIS